MQIRAYDEVDPHGVYRLSLAAFGWAMTAEEVRGMRRRDPRHEDGYAVYAVECGEVVAQVVPMRFCVRLTTGVEEVGGLQGVCSLPSVWGRGFSRRLIAHAHEHFREEGLRISTLTSSRNIRGYGIYRKAGYVDVAPFYRGTRQMRKRGARPATVRLRRATRRDLPRIHELYHEAVQGLFGWTERPPQQLPARTATFPRYRKWYQVVVREGTVVGYLRSRPEDLILMEEVVAPRLGDFRATVALLERRARGHVATVNWITCRRDQDRFRGLGYDLDLVADTTMAMPLTRDLRARDFPRLFGGAAGRFVQYPTDDF